MTEHIYGTHEQMVAVIKSCVANGQPYIVYPAVNGTSDCVIHAHASLNDAMAECRQLQERDAIHDAYEATVYTSGIQLDVIASSDFLSQDIYIN